MSNDPLQIHIEIGGDAKEALERIGEAVKDGTIALGVGKLVAQVSRDRISKHKNTAPDGTPWAPLTLATLQRKKAKGYGHQGTLQQRGSMWRSIVADNASGNTVDVGAMSVYARIHQFGGKTGKGHKTTIPARPYIGVGREEEEAIQRWVEKAIGDLLEGD